MVELVPEKPLPTIKKMAERKSRKKIGAEDDNQEKITRRIIRKTIDEVDGWVNEQYESHQKSPTVDSDRIDDDSNMDVDEPDDGSLVETGGRKSAFQYSKEVFDMKCEWAECNFESVNVDHLVHHVASHWPQMEQRDTGIMHCCLWDSCGFDSVNSDTVVRHINYHSYHTKIKAIGTSIMKRSKLLDCALDYAGRNLLPVLPHRLSCEWDDCDHQSDNFQLYLYHVHCHVHILPKNKTLKVICEWRDCKKEFSNCHKLRDHVRTHTQEKLVGCPVCGTQFSSKTKFYDHCKRQTSNQKKGFQCSHCRKSFATERILREHIRLHINVYKCPLCDMTCPFASTLTLHIRYRHLELKPFKCSFCDHRSKTQRDLENHQLTHCSENFWVCEQDDCEYSCRNKSVLQEHYAKNHAENVETHQFCCHICPMKYRRGADLTVHLKKEHSYRWASGHSRFKYVREEDGFFRLQTVRYESIEVTQEMMNKTSRIEPAAPGKRFKCIVDTPTSITIREDAEEECEQDFCDSASQNKDLNDKERTSKHLVSLDDDSDSSDSSNFGETLKKYLGLTGTSNFIKVVKNTNES